MKEEQSSLTNRTHLTKFAKRLESARYSQDICAVKDIVDELEEYPYKEPYRVELDRRYGVYDELVDTMLVPAIYEELQAPHPELLFDLGYFIVRRNGKYGIVRSDVVGTEIYPCVCDKIIPYDYYKCIFEQNGHQGFLEVALGSITVTEILPAIYDSISEYDERRMHLQLCIDGKVGLYGAQIPLPPIYDGIYIPQIIGWIKVKYKGQWGYIDKQGTFTDDIDRAFLYVYSRDSSSVIFPHLNAAWNEGG